MTAAGGPAHSPRRARTRFFERAELLKWLPGVLLCLGLVCHAQGWWVLRPVQQLDAWTHDLRLTRFARDSPDERLAIVDIDERSLAALGRWPWSRGRLAELVEALFERQGVRLVGLDIVLAEPDHSSGLATLDRLAAGPLKSVAGLGAALDALRPVLDDDQRLEAVLQRWPVVLGFHLTRGPEASRAGHLPPAWASADETGPVPRFEGWGGNLERFQCAARGGGFLEAWVDPDGVRRQTPLLAQVDGQVQPALALAMAKALRSHTSLHTARGADGWPERIRLTGGDAPLEVELGSRASVWVPYPRLSGLVRVVSALDVLEGRLPPASLRGRVVLIGTSVPGLGDRHATPVSEHLPGFQGHAAMLSGLLEGRLPHTPVWAREAETLALLTGLALLLPLAWRSLGSRTVGALIAAAALLGSNLLAWATLGWSLPLAGPLLLVAGLLAWQVFHGHFLEAGSRRRLATLFGQYVPPELVERMSHDPWHYDMQGRNAELTVLFADLRGFTSVSERLPATELAALINEFLSEMTDIVRAHGGTLDKYIGDAVMAFWGAPVADPLHARHAVAAAHAMQDGMAALNQQFAGRGWPALELGIGINTGPVVVGDLGSRHRRAYTVLGDAVNVAARLQELSEEAPSGILLGQTTATLLPEGACRLVGTRALRGRQAAVAVYAAEAPVPALEPASGPTAGQP